MSINDGMNYILDNLDAVQRECAATRCSNVPLVRCTMNLDRFEQLGPNELMWTSQSQHARYRPPNCARWDFRKGDEYTLVGFHSPPPTRSSPAGTEFVWMHVVFYGLYVPTPPATTIPHGYSTA